MKYNLLLKIKIFLFLFLKMDALNLKGLRNLTKTLFLVKLDINLKFKAKMIFIPNK